MIISTTYHIKTT